MENLAAALFLSVAANRIIEAMAEPVRRQYPGLSLWWLIYVGWLVGGLLGWASGIDLFAAYFADGIVGRVLTAVVIGGGSNLIADIFNHD